MGNKNGICVWHEPFEAKYSSFLEYYIMRNQLIDNAFHCTWYGKKQAKKAVWIHCRQEMMLYRYKNVDLYIRGIRDFLKGPQWLMQQDGEALHKDIMAAGYKFAPLSELPMAFDYGMLKEAWNMTENKLTRLKRRYTLNGLLVSSIGDRIVPVAWATPLMCYRRNRVMHYDITTQKGFMTQRSFKESYRCMKETFKVLREIDREYDKAKEAYRNQGLKLRTREFWNKYLGI